MAYENEEAIPRGAETPNVYGPADKALTVQESQLIGSVRKNDKVFIQDVVWTSQPQQAVGIDWSNPITRGLVVAFNHPNKLDHVKNSLASRNGTVTSSANGVSFGASSSLSVTDTPLEKFTIVSGAFASASTGTLFSRTSGVGGSHRQNYVLSLNGGTTPRFGFETSGSYPYIASSISVSSGAFVVAAASYDGATQKVYTNGITGGAQVAATPTTSIASVDTQVGAVYGTDRAVPYTGAGIKFAYLWNRALSDAEILSISQNPWQIFKPIPAKLKHYIPQQPLLPSKVGIPGLIEQSKRPWASQPQGPVQIDWSNPITKGLVTVIGADTEFVSGKPMGNTGGCTKSITKFGVGRSFTSATQFLSVNAPDNFLTSACTILSLFNRGGNTPCLLLGQIDHSSETWAGTNLWVRSNNQLDFLRGSVQYRFSSQSEVPSGECCVVVTHNGNYVTAPVALVNGLQMTFSLISANPFSTSTNPVRVGALHSSAAPSMSSTLSVAWNRALSAAEIRSINQNPWQIFKPLSYKQFVGQNTLPNIQVYREKLMWTSQPQQEVDIDLSHPVFAGDWIVWHNGAAYTPKGRFYAAPVTNHRVATQNGVETGGDGGRVVVCPFVSSMPKTMLYLGTGFMTCSSSTDGAYRGLARASVNNFGLGANAAGSVGRRSVVITGHNANAASVVRVGSFTETDWEFFNNGVKYSPTFSGSGAAYSDAAGSARLTIGWNTASGVAGLTKATLMIVSTAIIDSAVARSLSQNPWQIFKPLSRRIENRTPVKPQPLLPKYTPWTSQPPIGVQLNISKAKELGVVYLAVANEGGILRDLVGGSTLTNPGSNVVSNDGRVWKFNGAQQANKPFVIPNGETNTNNLLVCAKLKATSSQAGIPGAAFGVYRSTGLQAGFGVGFNSTNQVGLAQIDNNGANLITYSSAALNRWYHVYANAKISGDNGYYAWINGVPATNGQGSTVTAFQDGQDEIAIGAQHRSTGFLRNFTGDIEWVAIIHNASLNDSFAARLYEDGFPYNLFKPIKYPARLK